MIEITTRCYSSQFKPKKLYLILYFLAIIQSVIIVSNGYADFRPRTNDMCSVISATNRNNNTYSFPLNGTIGKQSSVTADCSENPTVPTPKIRAKLSASLKKNNRNVCPQEVTEEATEFSPYHEIHGGEKDVIVHLFEWRWNDIADECERFLGPKEFAGVQVSPPNEHSILWEPKWNQNVRRPWFERYRPISYIIQTRSGNEKEFLEMIRRCNTAGVRIFVDAVINHMSYYKDIELSTAGSHFNSETQVYDAVPYKPVNFNSRAKCGSKSGNIDDFQDVNQLRNCRLLGLNDLDQSNKHTHEMILGYLSHLIKLGVGGFRVDAAKHMWPKNLKNIYSELPDLNSSYFPAFSRPFIYNEVGDLGLDPISAKEYTQLGKVTEFKFGVDIAKIFLKVNGANLTMLRSFTLEKEFLCSQNALVFVDNHDTQRGHGVGEMNRILTFRDSKIYTLANVFMLSWPYGTPSLMSSYNWPVNRKKGKDVNDWFGPPHDEHFRIETVAINSDGTCSGRWICEHRWLPITNMVALRNVVGSEPVSHWWDDGDNAIAFSRGNKAFLVFNNGDRDLETTLETNLPPGIYCDVIEGSLVADSSCSGGSIVVGTDGQATVKIKRDKEVPAIALHVAARIGSIPVYSGTSL